MKRERPQSVFKKVYKDKKLKPQRESKDIVHKGFTNQMKLEGEEDSDMVVNKERP